MDEQKNLDFDEVFEFEEVKTPVWEPQPGQSITGVYINYEPGDEKRRISPRYYIENKKGVTMLWGSAVLNSKMALIKIGTVLRITFKGKEYNPNTKRDVKQYKIESGKLKE